LSRERIADELLKLLGMPSPSPTVATMLDRSILKPVLPEIGSTAIASLDRLIAAETTANIDADPLRRLSALLPRDSLLAEKVAVRLKLSNRARKRLACAAEEDLAANPRALAYRTGMPCAVDRLLLANRPTDVAALQDWPIPKLPIGGGALVARGLTAGPKVARTLRAIEDAWVDAGFPTGDAFKAIVAKAMP
jgi:poly(A) polymerase